VIEYWKDSPALERRLERVAAIIGETIENPAFPLKEAVAAAAEPNGKLLRPALLIIGAGFGNSADPVKLERLAAAIELLHVATLIHDDIIDEAPIRRGRPSLHSNLGVKEAVLAGDWLFSRCFLLSSESAKAENARGLSRLIAAICSAEISQDIARFEYSPSIRRYFRTIAGKTAALFSLALYAGASEANAGRRIEQTLRRAGYGIGMAFQVIDDILDFESDETAMRKPVGRDITEGLTTLPLIYALQADGPGIRALLPYGPLTRPVGSPETEEAADKVATVVAQVVKLGGVEKARADARRFTSRALQEIESLPSSSARDELVDLTERLLQRSY
jgi:heptaprenyl diphosphate synthase